MGDAKAVRSNLSEQPFLEIKRVWKRLRPEGTWTELICSENAEVRAVSGTETCTFGELRQVMKKEDLLGKTVLDRNPPAVLRVSTSSLFKEIDALFRAHSEFTRRFPRAAASLDRETQEAMRKRTGNSPNPFSVIRAAKNYSREARKIGPPLSDFIIEQFDPWINDMRAKMVRITGIKRHGSDPWYTLNVGSAAICSAAYLGEQTHLPVNFDLHAGDTWHIWGQTARPMSLMLAGSMRAFLTTPVSNPDAIGIDDLNSTGWSFSSPKLSAINRDEQVIHRFEDERSVEVNTTDESGALLFAADGMTNVLYRGNFVDVLTADGSALYCLPKVSDITLGWAYKVSSSSVVMQSLVRI